MLHHAYQFTRFIFIIAKNVVKHLIFSHLRNGLDLRGKLG